MRATSHLVFAALVAPAVRAQAPEDPKKAAYARFGEGEVAFEDGNFARAAASFLEAFALDAQPAYLYNRALSFARLGRPAAAAAIFRHFLTTFPGSPRKAEVEAELEKALVAAKRGATVEARGPAWRVSLADPAVPELAHLACQIPCTLIADPGQTTVVATDGVAKHKSSRKLAAGEVWAFTPELGVAPGTASWVAWSVGAAGLVTGAVFGVLALDAEGEGEDLVRGTRTPRAEERLETLRGRVDDYALVADLGFALAITGATLGLVLMVGSDDPQPEGLTWRF